MKTNAIKHMLFAGALTALVFVGCQKEEAEPGPGTPQPAANAGRLKPQNPGGPNVPKWGCTPSGSVTGANIISRLNSLTLCLPAGLACPNGNLSTDITQYALRSVSGFYYIYNPVWSFTPAQQTELIDAAYAWALSAAPAGYTFNNMTFTQGAGWCTNQYTFNVKAVYIKCI